MKLIKNIIFTIFISMLFIGGVKANSIDNIDMKVYIDSMGNANIEEVWEAYLTQGTEGYKPYSDLGISEITNFTVTDDRGVTYENIGKWNTNASFSSKKNKNGIHTTSNGVELCFGISEYGNRTYTLKYTITNFVTQYKDTQGIYFTFLDMNQYIGGAKVTIYSDTPFTIEDNVKIWGFGHIGTTTIVDGKIVIETTESLKSTDYVSGLVRFESNMFNTRKKSNLTFDDVYDDAMIGTGDEGKIDEDSGYKSVNPVIAIPLMILILGIYMVFNPVTWIIVFIFIYAIKGKTWLFGSSKADNRLVFEGGKDISKGEINYFRELPCNKDIFYAYFVTYSYGVSQISTAKEGILGAILLKWILENKITITETKKGLFNFKDNNYAVDFNNMSVPSDEIEVELYNLFVSAAGINKVLEPKEFERWCTKNYYKLSSCFDKVLNGQTTKLEDMGLIVKDEEEVAAMFGKKKTITIRKVNRKVRDEAIKMAGLKKFLLETSIDEKKFIEVHLWDYYLMYAELLGIADKVKEQFSKLYPDFKEVKVTNINTITSMANVAYKGYTVGVNRASARSYSGGHSYSGHSSHSGGGGHSYHSGGHSSSGSHGGGFR